MVSEKIKQIMFEKELNEKIEELERKKGDLISEVGELQKRMDQKEGKRITANRQLLLFHYLGFLDAIKFPTKEKKYNLFYILIDKNRQAVKDFCNYRDQFKTEKYKKFFNEEDLSFVSELLSNVGLSDLAEKVETDKIRLKF